MKNRSAWLPALMIIGVLMVVGIATYGFHARLAEKRAEANTRDLVEKNAIHQFDEAWQTMCSLDGEALKEINRINRLREANKDVKDLKWWKRLNEQGDQIKEVATDIGAVRDMLIALQTRLYPEGKTPTMKELDGVQSQLRALEKSLKEIRKALDKLRSL